MTARPICFRLLTHCDRRAASRAACTAGNSSAIRTAMIAITTNNSIKVKAGRERDVIEDSSWIRREGGLRRRVTRDHTSRSEAIARVLDSDETASAFVAQTLKSMTFGPRATTLG